MDEERLGARLRSIDTTVEPDQLFVKRLHDQLAAELGLAPRNDVPRINDVRLPAGASWAARSRRVGWLLAAAAVALVMLSGLASVASSLLRPSPTPTLLDKVRAAGTLEIAIRPDSPQVAPPGAFGGFDNDVAQEIARRVGLAASVLVTPATDMFRADASGGWDIAMPSTVLSPGSIDRFATTTPYYHWPVYVLTPAITTARSVPDLTGATICTVAGSVGEAWLLGTANQSIGIEAAVPPPTNIVLRSLADDQACLDDMAGGHSAALVTQALSTADLATRPTVTVLTGRPVLFEGRVIIASRLGADPDSLLRLIQDTLNVMRQDGTLATLSAQRFGGEDLTLTPNP